MCTFKLLTILILIQEINCGNDTDTLTDYGQHFPPYTGLMIIFSGIVISCVIRSVLTKYSVQLPSALLISFLGLIWGISCLHSNILAKATDYMLVNPEDMAYVYLPITTFSISFCLDIHIFLKTLPQILVIAIPVSLISASVFGVTMKLIIDPTWSILIGLVFGINLAPIYPTPVIYLLKQQSTRTRHLGVLLESEGLISTILGFAITKFLFGYMVSKAWVSKGSCGLASKGIQLWRSMITTVIRASLLGLLMGYGAGYIGKILLRKMSTDRLSILVMCFGIPLFTYAISEAYISGYGVTSVLMVGIMMGLERTSLPQDIDKFLTNMWKVVGVLMDIVIILWAAIFMAMHSIPLLNWTDGVLILVTYLMYYLIRFVCFLLFSPILSRLGYGMNLKNMIVCVWAGLKAPISLILGVHLINVKSETNPVARKFMCHYFCVYVLALLINGSFLRTVLNFMGLTKISMARQVNMNNCMKHIFNKRERTIAILKMDRFLADTNWATLIAATTIKHPYKIGLEAEDDDGFFMGYRFSYCPDCKKEIAPEPTAKEMKEMTREAKMRVLKAKKMSYSRQYENGMMSKEAIRILSQAVELAMDTDEATIALEGLQKKFNEEGWLSGFIRKRVKTLSHDHKILGRPPQEYWRRLCYHVVQSNAFERYFFVVTVLNAIFVGIDQYYHPSFIPDAAKPPHDISLHYVIVATDLFFCIHYIGEFVMKILANSWLHIWPDGFRKYFKSGWNIVDFFAMMAVILDTIYHIHDLTTPYHNVDVGSMLIIRQIMDVLRLVRFVRFLRYLRVFYPKLIKYLDSLIDKKMAFTYELGKSYAVGETEVLEMLPYMIDNKKIKEEVKYKIETDRVTVTKLLGMVQKEKPWIAITVKTIQAIRTILNSMREAIDQLRSSGWVDTYEQEKLMASLTELYKKVNSITAVQPSPPKVIFKEVAWMADDEVVIDFLFENVTVKKFEPGDVVFGLGNVADGIYIVVTGLFMIKYTPDTNVLESLHDYGRLPIADYLSCTQYEESVVDYIVSGNCIGELSTLTGRPYNSIITADAHSQVYVLSNGVIRRAMELNSDPIIGLECRIWKEVSIKIAIPLLMSVPAYQAFSQDQIKYALERAFMPNLSNYKIFAVTEMIQDVILIDGVAADFNTRELFVAPCCIPRTVQKLILPTSSLMNLAIDVITKLLIIPEKDVDEYDVMMLAEETCELVATGSSSRCLQHVVQQRRSRNRRRNRMRKMTSSTSRASRPGAASAASKAGSSISDWQSPSTDTTGSMVYFKGNVSDATSLFMGDSEEEEKRAFDYQDFRHRADSKQKTDSKHKTDTQSKHFDL